MNLRRTRIHATTGISHAHAIPFLLKITLPPALSIHQAKLRSLTRLTHEVVLAATKSTKSKKLFL